MSLLINWQVLLKMIRYNNIRFKSLADFFNFYKLSKDNIKKLISLKGILVNDMVIDNINFSLKKNDLICIDEALIKKNKYIPYKFDLNILYEDNDIVLVYKPKNILVHPDGNSNETLVNALSYYYRNTDVVFEHLHRLDYETDGIVLFSKNILAHSYLVSLFEDREVVKKYICLCHGNFNKTKAVIDAPISKDRHVNNKMIVYKGGKKALSEYEVLYNSSISKLLVTIKGGRKHQIRVHLSHIKHPICGDKLYGVLDNFDSLCLTFVYIRFIHPRTLELFEFEIESEL